MLGFLVGFFTITGLNMLLGLVMYSKYAGCDPLATDVRFSFRTRVVDFSTFFVLLGCVETR